MGDVGGVHRHELEPAVPLQGGAVLVPDRVLHPGPRVVGDPARVVVLVRHVELAVPIDAAPYQVVDLRPRKIHVPEVSRQQGGVLGRDPDRLPDAVPPVGPGPAVARPVPFAVDVLADLSGEAGVVGDDAAVRLGALDPGPGVLEDPLAVLLLTREQEGVGGKAGRQQVYHRIPPALAVPHRPAEPLGKRRIGAHRLVAGAARHVVEGQVVPLPGPVGAVLEGPEGRSHAAVPRTADDPLFPVVVGGLGILAEEQPGEAAGSLQVGGVARARGAEHVEEVVPLPLVEPVVPRLVLLDHHGVAVAAAVAAHRPGDGLEPPLAVGQEAVAPPEQVEERPVVEALVAVVEGVDALEVGRGRPKQVAVRLRVSLQHPGRRLLDGVEQPPLQDGPGRRVGRGLARFDNDGHAAAPWFAQPGAA